MPAAIARANAARSAVRARIEHVFAHQKNRFGLFIRTIGITRAKLLTPAHLAYNVDRLVFHESARSRQESARKTGKRPCQASRGPIPALMRQKADLCPLVQLGSFPLKHCVMRSSD
jgi:hypothetical protein